MASASRRTDSDLTKQLEREPYRFNFFQAVRLLERASFLARQADSRRGRSVGEDHAPRDEVVRFRTFASFGFPAGDIASVAPAEGKDDQPPEMTVSFLGLTGPAGVLPQHYTQLLIERIRRKDFSLRDFFDVFHHRLISLFYRAWRKYRYYIGYERAVEQGRPADDTFTTSLYSLEGLGTAHLRGRQRVDDETYLFYVGHFAHAPRNALALEQMLTDFLDVPARIQQFVGQWLYLEREDQSSLPQAAPRLGCNNELGRNVVVGERVWGVENKFRIRLGPLSYRDFLRFSPCGAALRTTAQLTRTYAGVEFDFEVQPVLRAAEIPACQLGGTSGDSYLGWNTWLISQPAERDAEDAVFRDEGWAEAGIG